jgi:hypothetical protein
MGREVPFCDKKGIKDNMICADSECADSEAV